MFQQGWRSMWKHLISCAWMTSMLVWCKQGKNAPWRSGWHWGAYAQCISGPRGDCEEFAHWVIHSKSTVASTTTKRVQLHPLWHLAVGLCVFAATILVSGPQSSEHVLAANVQAVNFENKEGAHVFFVQLRLFWVFYINYTDLFTLLCFGLCYCFIQTEIHYLLRYI